MKITRREMLKWTTAAATSGLWLSALGRMTEALAAQTPQTPILWVSQGADHNNFLAQLGQRLPSFLELVSSHWNLRQYETLAPSDSGFSYEKSISAPILVIEAIPSPERMKSEEGKGLLQALTQAKAAIFLGTDVCYGGMVTPSATVNDFQKICRDQSTPIINLPGIPVPPHHLVGTLGHLDLIGFPRLDAFRRPTLFYGELVCAKCENRAMLENGVFAGEWGQKGCLLQLGCKGPVTHNSCASHKWNGGESWCVGAGGACTGCSEPGYPDHGG
ncbi:MAG: hypothetical protein OEW12_10385, partial [Deltaproteobacteria bacterium]|nr:hypothetical protein [Deltaproteobacteria bacterium]